MTDMPSALSPDLALSLDNLRRVMIEKNTREAMIAYLERSIALIKAREKHGTTRDAMLANHHRTLADLYQGTPQ